MTATLEDTKYGNLAIIEKYEIVGFWVKVASIGGMSISFHPFQNVVTVEKVFGTDNKFIGLIIGIVTVNNTLIKIRLESIEESDKFTVWYIQHLDKK